jgi:hypothetical protein
MTKFFGRADVPQTVQQSLPYREMYKDGICRVNERLYTKTLTFSDITYQLAQNEVKMQIFESYCDYLNYFDSSISVQFSFLNQPGNVEEFQRALDIPDRQDAIDPIRREYAGILKNQRAKGNNGLVKAKYVTFGVEADTPKEAKMRLERIEADVIANFKALGVVSRSLNGHERLEVLHGAFHPGGQEKFRFDWRDVARSGNGTKDFIAPPGFDFSGSKTFRMGDTLGAGSFVQILAPELTDRMLADFLDLDSAVMVNIHIRSIDQAAAIKAVKRKLSDLDKMRIDEMVRPDRAYREAV